MKILLFILLLVINFQTPYFAQAPDTLWTKRYGGTLEVGVGRSVQQTNDGGYILTGRIYIYPNHYVSLIKTDNFGTIEWIRTYGEWELDDGRSVIQTADSGYVVLANTWGSEGRKAALIRTNELGDTLWIKIYEMGDNGQCFSFQQTSDGGYIIAGWGYSFPSGNVWLLKTDQNGHIEWTKTYGDDGEDYGFSVQQTNDGGYIIAGSWEPYSYPGFDLFVIKTNEFGDTLWTKTYGGNTDEAAKCIKQTADSGYIVVGRTDITHTTADSDIWVLRLNQSGDTLWTKTYGGTNNDEGNSIIISEDGNYIIVGTTESFGGGNSDIWLLKIDEVGDTLWTKTMGGYPFEQGNSVISTSDQGYIVIGSNEHIWLIKTAPISLIEPNGGELWYMGQEQTVSWKCEYIENVKIESSNDNGINWTLIIDSTLNNGTYSFFLNPQIPSTECLIKISNAQDSSIFDISDSVFTIAAISVISPNGGEYFTVGDTASISWFSEYMEDVSIKLSLNNGIDWISIIDSTTNSGLYSWVLNTTNLSDQCLIKISDLSDSSIYDVSDSVFTIDKVTSLDDDNLPETYVVFPNYPNPFNPVTTIKFAVTKESNVNLSIYNVLGELVSTLVNEQLKTGYHQYEFDASNLASGVYLYRIIAGDFVETKKMVLLR